jgi:hypothetical protein
MSCLTSGIGYPILHSADYANSRLYVLTIPDNFGDLYNFPAEVLTEIKKVLMKDLYVRVDGPSQVALFIYDNDTFIMESFLDENVDVKIVTDKRIQKLRDVLSDEVLSGEAPPEPPMWARRWLRQESDKLIFNTQVRPHSFRVFKCE